MVMTVTGVIFTAGDRAARMSTTAGGYAAAISAGGYNMKAAFGYKGLGCGMANGGSMAYANFGGGGSGRASYAVPDDIMYGKAGCGMAGMTGGTFGGYSGLGTVGITGSYGAVNSGTFTKYGGLSGIDLKGYIGAISGGTFTGYNGLGGVGYTDKVGGLNSGYFNNTSIYLEW